ncbi:MAG: hypothetical protein ACEQSU_15200 [Microgenomates group bacterium]
MSFNVTVSGIEDINRILTTIAPNEAKNLMRVTTLQLAKDISKDAAERMPSAEGTLKSAGFAKRERGNRTTIAATVRMSREAFYWRYLEYGQGPDNVEHAFFLQTLQALRPELDRKYLEIFTAKLIARLKRAK